MDPEKEYAKDAQLKREDVKALMEWLQKQPHLPKINEFQVILFLQSCYFSSEKAKDAIDTFYTIKTHSPEIFSVREPKSAVIQEAAKVGLYSILPKLTHEKYKVIFCKITDPDPAKYNQAHQVNLFDMALTLALHLEGTSQGHVFVIDMENIVFGHMARLNLMVVKKFFMLLQEGMPVRLKGFHFINAVSFMDKLMALIKPFMKKELLEILHIHPQSSSLEDFYKCVPKECLPSDLGGRVESCKVLAEKQRALFEQNADFFLEEARLLVDESQRPGKPKTSTDLFGVDGTLKKLDID